jgi:hypothetical protein
MRGGGPWHLAIANGGLAKLSDVVPRLTGARAARMAEVDWWPPPGRAI